ncbi:tyramine receptor tyra-2-like [Actinia tenebrosa]|uniref:Tyramine receptor tyra-2-like n=1 Tax=Actinia tenebrosa TaxID=6105 RepID=A0A6P8J5N7_ACTTE|nr:tyramine receptor tyra-2-like [Actinia tenebrosa]
MEAKEQENSSLRTNNSRNVSEIITRAYVFAPVSNNVKLVISTAMLLFGVYGLIANSLILYFKHKQHRRRRHLRQKPCSRSLTEYFINSLALSDLLSSLISLPLFTAEMFIDFVHNDWICKVNRFLNIIFPVITILNLLVIGVERYFASFHPFIKPSRRKAKKIVVGAWFLGALITLVPIPTYKLIHYDIGENSFTLMCKYDNSLALYQGLFLGFVVVIYFVPSSILIFVNLRILNLIRRHRNIGNRYHFGRLKATRMFVFLIFAFIIPYSLFSVYGGLVVILKIRVPLTADYLTRHMSVLLTFANGAISASILFHNERYLRKMLVDMLNDTFPHIQIQVTNKRENKIHPMVTREIRRVQQL